MALDRSSMIRSPFLAQALRGAAIALALQCGATAQAQQALLGVYYGNQGWAMDQLKAMEAWQGKRHAVVNLFTDWCNRTKTMDNLFKQQLPAIWANGNVPMIPGSRSCARPRQPRPMCCARRSGEYDTYLKAWAERLRLYVAGPDGNPGNGDDRRVYIRFAHEMNGNWYPVEHRLNGNTGRTTRKVAAARARSSRQGLTSAACSGSGPSTTWTRRTARRGLYPGDALGRLGRDRRLQLGREPELVELEPPQQVFDPMAQPAARADDPPLALTETAVDDGDHRRRGCRPSRSGSPHPDELHAPRRMCGWWSGSTRTRRPTGRSLAAPTAPRPTAPAHQLQGLRHLPGKGFRRHVRAGQPGAERARAHRRAVRRGLVARRLRPAARPAPRAPSPPAPRS